MKNFALYESFGSIDDILERSEKKMKNTVSRRLTRWGSLAACACLALVAGLSALEFFTPDNRYDAKNISGQSVNAAASNVSLFAGRYVTGNDALGYDTPGQGGKPMIGTPGTPDVELVAGTPGTPDVEPATGTPGTPDVEPVTDTPGTPDVEPVLNESAPYVEPFPDNGPAADDCGAVREECSPIDNRETLTLQEGLETETLDAYLLAEAPRGFQVESISLRQTEESNILFGVWTKSGAYDEIDWIVSLYSETDAGRVTAAADTRNYDLSLYPIPLAESVPEDLRQIVDHPIFFIDELTQDVVNRRARYVNDSGDTAGTRMTFGVLYGEVLVEVTTKGVSPEWLYEQLSSLK